MTKVSLSMIVILSVCLFALTSGCAAVKALQDSDEDGYNDDVDQFPTNSRYHATCIDCGGDGIVSQTVMKNYEFNTDGSYSNSGFFNPDYHVTVKVQNLDSVGGNFEVNDYAEVNGIKVWEDTQSSYISPGQTHSFYFRYDANTEVDGFRHVVTPPTKATKVEKMCPICNGYGKV
jgi:uncharacterized protein YceK